MRKAGPGDHRVQRGRKSGCVLAQKLGLAYLYRSAKPPALCADGGTAPHGREAQPMAVGDQLYADRMAAAL